MLVRRCCSCLGLCQSISAGVAVPCPGLAGWHRGHQQSPTYRKVSGQQQSLRGCERQGHYQEPVHWVPSFLCAVVSPQKSPVFTQNKGSHRAPCQLLCSDCGGDVPHWRGPWDQHQLLLLRGLRKPDAPGAGDCCHSESPEFIQSCRES